MLYTVSFSRRCYNGNIEKSTFRNVASWTDETSTVDPYTMRVLRDAEGNVMAGPVLSEIFDFQAQPEGYAFDGSEMNPPLPW